MSLSAPPDPVFVLRGANSQVTAACVHCPYLISGTQEGKIQVWDLNIRRIIYQCIHGNVAESILSIQSADSSILTHCRDGSVKIWDLVDRKLVHKDTFHCHSGTFFSMEINQDNDANTIMVPGPGPSEVDIMNLKKNNITSRLIVKGAGEKGHGMCMCGKFISQSQVLIGYENGCVALWDCSNNTGCVEDKLSCHAETVTALDFSSLKNCGVSGSVDDKLVVWSLSDGKYLTEKQTLTLTNPGVNAIRIRSDSKIFAVGGWDNNVRIFSLKKLQPLAVLSFHRESISSVYFSADFLLFCASTDQTISTWDIYR